MRSAGLYTPDQIREVIEERMRARWKLGRLLAAVARTAGPGRGKKIAGTLQSFTDFVRDKLKWNTTMATEAQRIGTLPQAELEKHLAEAHRDEYFATFAFLLDRARPYWYAASRRAKSYAWYPVRRAARDPKPSSNHADKQAARVVTGSLPW
jgi:hypothetical protein